MLALVHILFLVVEALLLVGIILYCVYITALLVSRHMEVPFVPTDAHSIHEIFSFIAPSKNARLLEIGCGDGRVICNVVKRYGLSGRGIDTNGVFVLLSRLRAWSMGISGAVTITKQDAREADFVWPDIVFMFMFPPLLRDGKMQEALQHGLRGGTYVVSHWYPIIYLADNEVYRYSGTNHETYVYKI